jgi:hypothetical protein
MTVAGISPGTSLMSLVGDAFASMRRRWRRLKIWLNTQSGTRKTNRRWRHKYCTRDKIRNWLNVIGLLILLAGMLWAMMFITVP